jgi:hypothetical protein
MKRNSLLGLLCVLFFCSISSTAHALTISPVRVEVAGDPGQTLKGELELFNEQADTKRFFSTFENFEPSGETGSPHFIGSEDGLATWLGTLPEVTIATNEKKVIPYTITIPVDAEPGGYFAAIFFGEQDPRTLGAGEVSIGGKLGVLLLVRVNGDIEEEGGISDFKIDNGGKLFSSLPVMFGYRFTNDGGDRVVPLGDVLIKNTFGGLTATLDANIQEGNVLPGSGRKFTVMWGESPEADVPVSFLGTVASQLRDFHIGLYTAELNILYGAANQPAKSSFVFFMLPWQLLSVVLFGLVFLFILIRQYNAWIVARSRA